MNLPFPIPIPWAKPTNRRRMRRRRAHTRSSPLRFALQIAAIALVTAGLRSLITAAAPLAPFALPTGHIAGLFTPEIDHWGRDIARWTAAYGDGLDPNLAATVMQIESCGHADISSPAGAQGLFQVMPFHFSVGEVMTDPETNARRGISYLATCYALADGDIGRTFACYNGGPSTLRRSFEQWAWETQRYYVYGVTIYNDARQNRAHSPHLDYWLNVGGAGLCALAAENLGAGRQPQVG